MTRRSPPSMNDWFKVHTALVAQPAGAVAQLNARSMPHPRDAGMKDAIPFPPVGQTAEFFSAKVTPALKVRQFGEVYDARLDTPPAFVLEQALQETPGSVVLGAALLGGLVGAILGGSKGGAMTGAAIGGAAGLAAVAVANARTSPETSAVAAELVSAVTTGATKPTAAVAKRPTKRRR